VSYQVKVRQQVRDFHSRLGPNDRRQVERALTQLTNEHGDIRALRERLDGYYRLRVGTYRILFRYRPGRIIGAHPYASMAKNSWLLGTSGTKLTALPLS